MAIFVFTSQSMWLHFMRGGSVPRKAYMKLRRYCRRNVAPIGCKPVILINTYRGVFKVIEEDGNCYYARQIVGRL